MKVSGRDCCNLVHANGSHPYTAILAGDELRLLNASCCLWLVIMRLRMFLEAD